MTPWIQASEEITIIPLPHQLSQDVPWEPTGNLTNLSLTEAQHQLLTELTSLELLSIVIQYQIAGLNSLSTLYGRKGLQWQW